MIFRVVIFFNLYELQSSLHKNGVRISITLIFIPNMEDCLGLDTGDSRAVVGVSKGTSCYSIPTTWFCHGHTLINRAGRNGASQVGLPGMVVRQLEINMKLNTTCKWKPVSVIIYVGGISHLSGDHVNEPFKGKDGVSGVLLNHKSVSLDLCGTYNLKGESLKRCPKSTKF